MTSVNSRYSTTLILFKGPGFDSQPWAWEYPLLKCQNLGLDNRSLHLSFQCLSKLDQFVKSTKLNNFRNPIPMSFQLFLTITLQNYIYIYIAFCRQFISFCFSDNNSFYSYNLDLWHLLSLVSICTYYPFVQIVTWIVISLNVFVYVSIFMPFAFDISYWIVWFV